MIEISAGIDLTALTLGALAVAVLLETLAPLRQAEQPTRRWIDEQGRMVLESDRNGVLMQNIFTKQ